MRLRQLQCPHLVTAISVSFCPPSLALESAPLGSLQNVLKRKQETIGQDIIHQIALQVRRCYRVNMIVQLKSVTAVEAMEHACTSYSVTAVEPSYMLVLLILQDSFPFAFTK